MWASDAVHGYNNVFGATLFPHNAGLGAERDPDLIHRIGVATAEEVRVLGMDWSFAPTLAVVQDDRWGRTYESYSENPAIVAHYARAVVEGLQAPVPASSTAITSSRPPSIASAMAARMEGATKVTIAHPKRCCATSAVQATLPRSTAVYRPRRRRAAARTPFLALFAYRHARPPTPLGADAARAIVADRWPDNVRGLRQAIERAVLLGTGDIMLSRDIAEPTPLAPDLSLARNEETLITAALERHAFNVSRAAAQLGLTGAALYRRMARYGL